MTISDIMLIVFSAVAIGGLYLVGCRSRKARRNDASEKDDH